MKRLVTSILNALMIAVGIIFGAACLLLALLLLETDGPADLQEPRTLSQRELVEREMAIVRDYEKANLQALHLYERQVRGIFEAIRDINVPAFTEELYSLGTKGRLGIAYGKDGYAKMTGDPAAAKNLDRLVSEIMGMYFPASEELQQDLAAASSTLQFALEKNRNEMAIKIAADLEDLGKQGRIDFSGVGGDVQLRMQEQLLSQAIDAAAIGMQAEALSVVGAEAITLAVLKSVAILTGSAVSGWSTCGITLVVGVGVDLWVSKEAQEKMNAELAQKVIQSGNQILYGNEGLMERATAYVEDVNRTQKTQVLHALANL